MGGNSVNSSQATEKRAAGGGVSVRDRVFSEEAASPLHQQGVWEALSFPISIQDGDHATQ